MQLLTTYNNIINVWNDKCSHTELIEQKVCSLGLLDKEKLCNFQSTNTATRNPRKFYIIVHIFRSVRKQLSVVLIPPIDQSSMPNDGHERMRLALWQQQPVQHYRRMENFFRCAVRVRAADVVAPSC
jgi:hypothetical protein